MTRSWPTARLGDVCQIVSGATPKTTEPAYWDGDIAWATPTDLSALRIKHISATGRRLTARGLSSCSAVILPPGSVLLSSRAPIGLVAINTVPMATNQGFKSLVPDSSAVCADYLYWWLRANTKRLQALGRGATFTEVSKAIVAEIELPLPTVDEQRRIAAVFDQVDALRAKRETSLALLDSLNESTFLEMFGNPSAWASRQTPLLDLVDPHRPITYGILKPGPHDPSGVPYVRVIDMRFGGIDASSVRRTSSEISHQYRRSLLRAGDLLLSIRGHVGRLAEVPPELEGANITQDSARLAITEASPRFVLEYLRTTWAQRWMQRHIKGAAVRGINLGDVKRLPVPVFDRADQDEFVRRARTVERTVGGQRRSASALDDLFASVQHRAFAGQL